MELGETKIKRYSDRIRDNISKLKELTPDEIYIPIHQVAYKFTLGGEDMYLDFPYNKKVKQQNDDFNNPASKIFGLDKRLFDYFKHEDNSKLKFIHYQFEYFNDKPIIRKINSTISNFEDELKFKDIIDAFSIIHYNATRKGDYLDNIPYEEKKLGAKYNTLLFVFQKFEFNIALKDKNDASYLNVPLCLTRGIIYIILLR